MVDHSVTRLAIGYIAQHPNLHDGLLDALAAWHDEYTPGEIVADMIAYWCKSGYMPGVIPAQVEIPPILRYINNTPRR